MWRGFHEFKFSTEQWVYNLYEDPYKKAHYMYIINRALRRAARDKVISRQEQKNLWNMIIASEEDCYVAISALENKYKSLTKIEKHGNEDKGRNKESQQEKNSKSSSC